MSEGRCQKRQLYGCLVWFDGLIQELYAKLICIEWDAGREKRAHTTPRREASPTPPLSGPRKWM